jgi:lysophospholipase L1-like esterase
MAAEADPKQAVVVDNTRVSDMKSTSIAPADLTAAELNVKTTAKLSLDSERAKSVVGEGKMFRVLIFGDSIADGLAVKGAACEVCSRWGEPTSALLAGFPGLDYYLDGKNREAGKDFDAVVLVAGSNDLGNDAFPREPIDNLMRMHRKCRSRDVVSISVTLLHDEFNAQLVRRCAEAGGIPVAHFLHEDMDTALIADDGIHLNDQGKAAMSRSLVQPIILALARAAAPTLFRKQIIAKLLDAFLSSLK